jgi:uncharacterized protein (DUF1778 family)
MPARPTRRKQLDLRLTPDGEIGLDADQWKAFIAALDAPPRPMLRLKRLFKEPGFFDPPPALK